MKFSTLIIRIEELTPSKVTYTSKTDMHPRDYKHIIPASSKFPFDKLKLGSWYALISVKPDDCWFWFCSFGLSTSEVLVDTTFQQELLLEDM